WPGRASTRAAAGCWRHTSSRARGCWGCSWRGRRGRCGRAGSARWPGCPRRSPAGRRGGGGTRARTGGGRGGRGGGGGGGGPGRVLAVVRETAPVPTLFFGLGERGKRAERVADEAVEQAVEFLRADPPGVDAHSADQLVLPLALASGPSAFPVAAVTQHLL